LLSRAKKSSSPPPNDAIAQKPVRQYFETKHKAKRRLLNLASL
jgi:hypothetical protein